MNDGTLRVNFNGLSTAAADIQAAVKRLDAELARLDDEGRRLMGTWDGAAQQAYVQRQADWTKAADSLKAILRQIGGAVEESNAQYLATERSAAQRFGG
ncbi:WXG100 family type VII secretion target [Actinoplanes sp. NPDC051859]|uniref:WXG100 family type VII secretion target n=1 Tax=Actinoplanes sp. NPDC051859 TaxID=3363909 RepID=UPI0037B8D9E6